MATHSSILAWRIPWIEKPGGLQSMGLQRVEHDKQTNTSFTFNLVPMNKVECFISSFHQWVQPHLLQSPRISFAYLFSFQFIFAFECIL